MSAFEILMLLALINLELDEIEARLDELDESQTYGLD